MAKRKYSKTSRAHRRLFVSSHYANPQRGDDVKALQRAINERAKARGLRTLKIDGEAGRDTIAKGRQVAWALGIDLKADGITAYVQTLIRRPGLRNPVQRGRAKRRAKSVERVARDQSQAASSKVSVTGNKVKGGTKMQRVVAAAMEAAARYYSGKSKRFYSQTGATQFDLGITGEERGMRSDCSQWFVSMFKSAGAPDPCEGGYDPGKLHYTGTIPNGGHRVSREQLRPGAAICYGSYPYFHVEMWVGNGDGKTTYAELARAGHPHRDRTIGHGSPPVDYGDIDMARQPNFFNFD